MKIIDHPFPGAALLELEPFGDERGSFVRIFDRNFFRNSAMILSLITPQKA